MAQLDKIDRALMSMVITLLMATVGIYLWDPKYFMFSFAAEDGFVEYGTALALLLACVVLIRNGLSIRGRATRLMVGLTFFYAFLFFFGAGEEISWGQRIFGWETSEAMKEINRQDEINLHNIEIGGVALTKHLFGPVLTAIVLLYLVVLPLVYPRVAGIARLVDRLAIPVPGLRHAALALIGSIIISVIDVDRKWEVYEFEFALLMVSTFLLPQNRDRVT